MMMLSDSRGFCQDDAQRGPVGPEEGSAAAGASRCRLLAVLVCKCARALIRVRLQAATLQ